MKTSNLLLDPKVLENKTPEECDFIFDLRTAYNSFVNQEDGALFVVYSKKEQNGDHNLVMVNRGELFDSTLYAALYQLASDNGKVTPLIISVLGELLHKSPVSAKAKRSLVTDIITYLNNCIIETKKDE